MIANFFLAWLIINVLVVCWRLLVVPSDDPVGTTRIVRVPGHHASVSSREAS